ncbi:ROK family transcriptional regulator [Rhizobium sp. Root1203]|jgi:predicted NBD/HSP70 family sugar kinase|uniref:ROK family transcriptional regulator n=1 Tax=Rhizobium sp. Root1203 TaxID=1736427 RepID=UPI00070A8329|nr:ROK family transcriptional regulator [Rhizobium sp. Root1203]KQV19945.1 ROK family transcriptional regulator [Rhizobium sp. Root1203]
MGVHHGQILCILRDGGPQSRASLARSSKLSATTLTHVTAQLLRAGVVAECDVTETTGIGRPGQAIRLVPDAFHVAGIHLGAGLVQIAITDLKAGAKSIASFDFSVRETEPDDVVSRAAETLSRLRSELGEPRLLGVGVAVPGPVNADQRSILVSINTGWSNLPLADMFEEKTGLPAVLEHNVSSMALAEVRYGIGRQVPGVLYVYLRTGLGAGLVVDGMPFRPGGHGAVELGHIQISTDGPLCSCGNHGCLESYVNEAVLMRAVGLKGQAPDNLLKRLEATEAWAPTLDRLTDSLAIAINLLAPDLIILGGHLGEAPDSLFDHLLRNLPPRVMPHMRDVLRIERSGFGPLSGAIGGVAVALDHFFYSGVRQ